MTHTQFISLEAIGLVSFAIGTLAFVPYIKDTLQRKSRPQRSSWLIWAFVAGIAFFSQLAEGATTSMWFAASNFLVTIIVLGLSIPFGSGTYFDRQDATTLALAGGAILVWVVTDVPAYALFIAIGVNMLAASLTVTKAYRAPQTETLSCWVMGGIASALGVISVGAPDPILVAYPVYMVAMYSTVSFAILKGRRAARTGVAAPALRLGA